MARLESPALTLVEFGDEKLWRSAWRFSHFQVRHIIRSKEFILGKSYTCVEKIRIARVLLKSINERDFGTQSRTEYLSRMRRVRSELEKRLSGTSSVPPDEMVGDTPLYKVCD